jgi:PAS domain S-box-containing protein
MEANPWASRFPEISERLFVTIPHAMLASIIAPRRREAPDTTEGSGASHIHLRRNDMKQARDNGSMMPVIRIVALYLLFSGLWIYSSDTILGKIIHDPLVMTRLSMYKGFGFILVTSSLLFVLIFRHSRRLAEANRRLRESESLLRFTAYSVENISDAVYWVTEDGRFWDCNAAACRMLGYSREELLSMSVTDVDPGYAGEDRASHLAELREKGSRKHQRFHTTRDGSAIPVEITTSYFVYEDQEFFCSIVRDITDRVEAENEAAFFRALIEYTREPVYVLNLEDGRMFYVNPAACSHYGRDFDTLKNMRIPDWDPSFDMDGLPGIREQLKLGKLLRFETTHRVASGELIPVEVTASYLKLDAREFTAGNFHDIRERKAMESALRESERNLIEAQRIAKVGNWTRDLSGNLLYASAECRRIFGREAGKSPGTFESFLELVHPDDRQRIRATFEDIVRTGQPFTADFVIIRPDGTEGIVRARGEMVCGESGAPEKVIGTVQDITEQRKAEADRIELERQMLNIQKLESLGVLAGGIAHDFNNLLTGILGNLSMMRMDLPPDHHLHDRIGRCEKAVHQATGLTCQLLTFSRGGEPVKKVIDLGRVIRDSVSFSLHGSNVAVEMKISDDLWSVEADEGQIGQVFQNLLINADQSMPQGGIVRVEASNQRLSEKRIPSLEPGEYVLVSVVDQGMGIQPENLDRIFDPYFTTKKSGTGLGLTALYSIVRKHGGQVLVSSRVGIGSVFRVYLPACAENMTAETVAGYAASSPVCTGEGFILVMDDEEIIRDMAKEMLSLLGYRVTTCSSGEEVIELYEKSLKKGDAPDAVIMDLTIPGKMGGQEASTAIHALDPTAVLIVSSGYSNDPVLSDFRKYGFSDSLAKPFRVEDLAAALRRVLDTRRRSG